MIENLLQIAPTLARLLPVIERVGIQAFDAGVVFDAHVQAALHPDYTVDQLAAQIEGDTKHTLRGKIGWGVDILFGIGPVEAEIKALCLAAAEQAMQPAGG